MSLVSPLSDIGGHPPSCGGQDLEALRRAIAATSTTPAPATAPGINVLYRDGKAVEITITKTTMTPEEWENLRQFRVQEAGR